MNDRTSQPTEPLDALKALLLDKEQQQLQQLNARLDDHQLRSEELAEVLPDSLRQAERNNGELADALERPVTQCIERSIERDPETIIRQLNDLEGGSPVVHEEYGIGRYLGLIGFVWSTAMIVAPTSGMRLLAWSPMVLWLGCAAAAAPVVPAAKPNC